MPAFIAVRLFRMLPVFILIAVFAVGVYAITSWRRTPARAQELLGWTLIVLNSVFFAISTLGWIYALFEHNEFVADFFLTGVACAFVLIIASCAYRWNFLRKHPHWRAKRTKARSVSLPHK